MKLVEIRKKGLEVFSFDSVQNEAPKEARIAKKSIRKKCADQSPINHPNNQKGSHDWYSGDSNNRSGATLGGLHIL